MSKGKRVKWITFVIFWLCEQVERQTPSVEIVNDISTKGYKSRTLSYRSRFLCMFKMWAAYQFFSVRFSAEPKLLRAHDKLCPNESGETKEKLSKSNIKRHASSFGWSGFTSSSRLSRLRVAIERIWYCCMAYNGGGGHMICTAE